MDKTKWIIFAVVVVALFGGIILLNKSNEKSFTGDAKTVIADGPIADHVYGTDTKKVVFIEYGDYQCPGCGAMYQAIKNITSDYQDKITFVFREFPLTTLHANALAAATAAEAAGLQNKYWEMHDILYENQQSWQDAAVNQRESVFQGYAAQIGLDVNKFKTDLTNKDIADKISRDRSSAKQFDVNQTPTFVLNGKKLDSTIATDQVKLRQTVEDALKTAYPDFQPKAAAFAQPSE